MNKNELEERVKELEEFARWAEQFPLSADIREKAGAVLGQTND